VNELVRFAMTAYFPRVDDLPGLAELGVEEKIARLRRESTSLLWLGVASAAVFFQLSPLLTIRRPVPATWLSPEDLDRHAHALATHRVYVVRQITSLLKLVAGMFWGQSPEIRALLGLPPYPDDPGTRRIEEVVPAQKFPERAPATNLVTLGRKEKERGRDRDRGKGLHA
jgi:hypothetical protein